MDHLEAHVENGAITLLVDKQNGSTDRLAIRPEDAGQLAAEILMAAALLSPDAPQPEGGFAYPLLGPNAYLVLTSPDGRPAILAQFGRAFLALAVTDPKDMSEKLAAYAPAAGRA